MHYKPSCRSDSVNHDLNSIRPSLILRLYQGFLCEKKITGNGSSKTSGIASAHGDPAYIFRCVPLLSPRRRNYRQGAIYFPAHVHCSRGSQPMFSGQSAQFEDMESSRLKPELNARLIAEVTLVLVSRGKSVAKPGKYVIGLDGSKGDGMRERNVDAATDHEVECIVARIVDCAPCKCLTQVAIETGMRSAK